MALRKTIIKLKMFHVTKLLGLSRLKLSAKYGQLVNKICANMIYSNYIPQWRSQTVLIENINMYFNPLRKICRI